MTREQVETEAICTRSLRTDGRHYWERAGDDPFLTCAYCWRLGDAATGKVASL
ncbi:hypothetical protein ACFXG4_27275 [Nocardia sp. NPDC059246]|uniref:hypothetical protein n=1 Tax=unclassified Nocardia TaxID=2637762 RepID=UPI003677C17A